MTADAMAEALRTERVQAEWVFAKGIVKHVEHGLGTGLISADEGDDDLPFELTSVRTGGLPLSAGARVEFVVDEGAHGLEAFEIVLLESR